MECGKDIEVGGGLGGVKLEGSDILTWDIVPVTSSLG